MITTEQTYDTDLDAAHRLLADRLEAAIGDDEFLAVQLPKTARDVMNNEWVEGISVEKWANRAAARLGI